MPPHRVAWVIQVNSVDRDDPADQASGITPGMLLPTQVVRLTPASWSRPRRFDDLLARSMAWLVGRSCICREFFPD